MIANWARSLRAVIAPASIPKKLHQVWMDKNNDHTRSAPQRYHTKEYIESFQAHNKDFEYHLWNFGEVKALMAKYPKYKALMDRVSFHIEKCDIARLVILLEHGGVYTDLDFTCLKPLQPLIANRSFLWCYDDTNHLTSASGLFPDQTARSIFNGFIGATPGHPVIRGLLDFLCVDYKPDGLVWASTGPMAVGRYAQSNNLNPQTRPDLFVDTCLLLPVPMPATKGIIGMKATECTTCNCDMSKAFVTTDWYKGSGWQYSPDYVGRLVRKAVERHWWKAAIAGVVCVGAAKMLM